MRFNKVTLKGFSSHKDTSLEFTTPVSLIVGGLGAGKSSIQQAIEYGFTGRTDLYRKATDDFDELIHDIGGVGQFTVTVESDKGTVSRGRSKDAAFLRWNDSNGDVKEAEIVMLTELKTRKPILSVVMNTFDFFQLEGKDQRDLILGLIGIKVDSETLAAAFKETYPQLEDLLGKMHISSVGLIDQAYKTFFDERTTVNRSLKELKPAPPPEGEPPPIEAIREGIRSLDKQKEVLIAEIGKAKGTVKHVGSDSVRKEYAELIEWSRHPDNQKPKKAEFEALTAEEAAVRKAANDARADKHTCEQALIEAKAKAMAHHKNVELLTNFNGLCVAGPHKCPAQAAEMKKALELEQVAEQVAVEEASKLNQQIIALMPKCEDRDKLNDIRKRTNELNEKLSVWNRKADRYNELKGIVAAMDAETPPAPVDTSEMDAKLAEINKRLEVGRGKLEKAQAWIYAKNQSEQVASRRRELEQRKVELEALVEFLGPKGIKVKLVDEKIGDFAKSINEYLAPFGFEIDFSAEPWQIFGKTRSLNRLSRSERFRAGVALQIAIAKWSGVNFVIIDNSEILVPEARKIMMQTLMKSGLDQAIVIATLMIPEAEFKPPRMPGLEVFMVKNQAGVSQVERV